MHGWQTIKHLYPSLANGSFVPAGATAGHSLLGTVGHLVAGPVAGGDGHRHVPHPAAEYRDPGVDIRGQRGGGRSADGRAALHIRCFFRLFYNNNM